VRHATNVLFYNFKSFLHDALARPGTGRLELAKSISETLIIRNTVEKTLEMKSVVTAREINHLLHFTPISNLKNILRLGFVPRKFLEMSGVKEIIKPKIPDPFRYDGRRECFCLSISWPNYKTFYFKRKSMAEEEWVVLKLNIESIVQHKCEFFKTNAASRQARKEGPNNIDELFYDEGIRQKLNLNNSFTTDPQAEVMSYSRIPPDWIEEIYIERMSQSTNREVRSIIKDNLLQRETGNNIKIIEDSTFFGPRKDSWFWKK